MSEEKKETTTLKVGLKVDQAKLDELVSQMIAAQKVEADLAGQLADITRKWKVANEAVVNAQRNLSDNIKGCINTYIIENGGKNVRL